MLKLLRYLLFPFSLIFALILWLRNWLFNKKVLRTIEFSIPIIGVGNLSVGGTGKTPMVEYLVQHFTKRPTAILSRGYKRRSKGFIIADENSTAVEIGDEPMQMHLKFPDLKVCVCEDRVFAIPDLLTVHPDVQIVVMDDAYQHRYLKPGLQILLTCYGDLYVNDWYLPTGNLRDLKSSSKRADIVIVTKCPPKMNKKLQLEISTLLNLEERQKLFFSTIHYNKPYLIGNQGNEIDLNSEMEVLLVTGIAKVDSLEKYLAEEVTKIHYMKFSDHHFFKENDIGRIKIKYNSINALNKVILTTEKDATRLQIFSEKIKALGLKIYVLPIKMIFLTGEEDFLKDVDNYVDNTVDNLETP